MASQEMERSSRQQGTQSAEESGSRLSRRQGSYLPSIFSVTPGEFFTMSPVTLMRRFAEDIDRAFGFGGVQRSPANEQQEFMWMPTVEVRQSGDNMIVCAELPGLSENDVKVEATEEGLIIQGERKREQTEEHGGVYRSERSYGQFYRAIPLPENAKLDEAKATFNNGVLEVTVPVPELQRHSRQIPVQGQSRTSEPGEQGRQEGRSKAARTAG